MKILIVSPFLPYPPDNGGAIRIYNLIKNLSDRHQIDLCCYRHDGTPADEGDLRQYCKIHSIPGNRSLRHWQYHVRFLLSKLPYSLVSIDSGLESCLVSVRNTCYDIVQFEFLELAHYAPLFKGISKTAVVVHYLAAESRQRLMTLWKPTLRKYYYHLQVPKIRQYEKTVVKNFDLCLVTDRRHQKQLKSWHPDTAVAYSRNGVDVDYFRPKPSSERRGTRMLYMGAFHLEPANIDGLKFLCENIFPIIRSRVPKAALDVIGKGIPKQLLPTYLGKTVRVHGYVCDVRPYFHRAAVFLLPLRGGSGTKIRILTAMAMGVPVVSTSIGAEGLEVTEGENIFIADDAQSFAEKTAALLQNGELRQRIGTAGRRLVEQCYSWQQVASELDLSYHSVVT